MIIAQHYYFVTQLTEGVMRRMNNFSWRDHRMYFASTVEGKKLLLFEYTV